MCYLQEIEIKTDNINIKFNCEIRTNNNKAPFEVKVLTYDPRINMVINNTVINNNEIYLNEHKKSGFQNADIAYRYIIDRCIEYSSAAKTTIQGINNPCNAPYINQTEQQSIVDEKGLNLKVLVNGK